MNLTSIIKYLCQLFVYSLTLIVILGTISSVFMSAYYYYSGSHQSYDSLAPEVKNNYEHMTPNEVEILLSGNWDHGWTFEEITGFVEKARSTKYVNVNDFGIRHATGEDKTSINDAIWMFGGSTTFGYGVGDTETIPYLLQKRIKISDVINFGRGYYFSEQENLLLMQLLKQGLRPKEVIFLDGINERCSIKVYQSEMKNIFATYQYKHTDISNYATNIVEPSLQLLTKALNKLGVSLGKSTPDTQDLNKLNCPKFGINVPLKKILAGNLNIRNSICEAFNIKCITFVQPFAGLHGLHSSIETLSSEEREILREKYVHLKSTFEDFGSIFLIDALDELKKHAFIDGLHYSAEANGLIAKKISSELVKINGN